MKQKRLLLLGAMEMHVPVIKKAKQKGIYVITCDYLKNNPGHKLANESYCESTTDKAAVLRLAREKAIDGIMTFCSDPAALTVSYVAEKLGLPGNPLQSVKILSEKDLFRTFQKEHGFAIPFFRSYQDKSQFLSEISYFKFPLIIKPVDSSGSKGVNKINSTDDIDRFWDEAMKYTRCKRVIVEEFIEKQGYQLQGDAFFADGKLKVISLGDEHAEVAPSGTSFPTTHNPNIMDEVYSEVERCLREVGFMRGGVNIEARVGTDGKIYIVEIGARNGGHYTPDAIYNELGYDFYSAAIDTALGLPYKEQETTAPSCSANMILYSENEGIFDGIKYDAGLEKLIVEEKLYTVCGEQVHTYHGSNTAIGVLLLKFDNQQQMIEITDNFSKYYTIVLRN